MNEIKTENELLKNLNIKRVLKQSFYVSPKYIKELIEIKLGIEDIGFKNRERGYIYSRLIYYKLCKNFTNYSLESIGMDLGDFSHATVLNGLKRFEQYKDQKFFIEYYSFYLDCCNFIYKETSTNSNCKDQLNTLEEVKHHYKIKFIKIIEKYRSIIKKQKNQINNLKNEPLIKEIADLDFETFEKLKPRLQSFLIMNSK